MNDKLKVGITGPISEINFGDYAMLINNLYELKIKDVVLFSYNKGFSELILKDYFKDFNITIIEVKLKEKLEETKKDIIKVGYQPFNYPTDTPIDILNRVTNLDEIKNAIDKIDILIVNGGGYFNHLWNNSLWRSDMLKKIMTPMLLANKRNKKIYFTGNGFGPFDSSEEFFYYNFNYLKNTIYAVRDRLYSEKYLLKLGIDKEKIEFLPDDLYILNRNVIELNRKDPLDIKSIGKYIAMEIYFPLEEIESKINEIKEFSDKIYEKYGYSIVFLPFDFQRGGMWQGEFLKNKLKNFYLYDIASIGYFPIQDLYYIIKNSEMVLCTRYHALVISVAAGIPVINMLKKVCDDYRYYYNKNYGVLEYSFDGLEFDEMDFLKLDFLETLKYLEENIESVILNQKKIFESKKYENNKIELSKIRINYLDRIRSGK